MSSTCTRFLFTCTRISAWQRASSPGAAPPLSRQLEGGSTLREYQQWWEAGGVKDLKSGFPPKTFPEERRSRAEWERGGRGRCWSRQPRKSWLWSWLWWWWISKLPLPRPTCLPLPSPAKILLSWWRGDDDDDSNDDGDDDDYARADTQFPSINQTGKDHWGVLAS